MDRKKHWEGIYEERPLDSFSWYQPKPEISLELIAQTNISKEDSILDVGGGDALLVDHLLELGYQDISVLDISEKAIDRAKNRLGEKANQVNWICSDVVDFKPENSYRLWHDRAAFHFLQTQEEIERYIHIAQQAIAPNGYLILGGFAVNGPTKCSGIEVNQLSKEKMKQWFEEYFEIQHFKDQLHHTPSQSPQQFVFGIMKRKPE